MTRHRLHLELVHRPVEPHLERFGAFLERCAGQRALDEQRKPPDIDERGARHIDPQQLDGRRPEARFLQRGAVLID